MGGAAPPAAPVVTAISDRTMSEGTPFTLDPIANFTDENTGDTHTATIDWGDGNLTAGTVTEVQGSGLGSVAGSHTYAGDGSYQVTISVTDGGLTGDDTLTITADNVAPTVTATGDQTVFEGTPFTLDTIASFTDPGTGDTHIATIAWGDGTVEQGTVTQGAGTGDVAGSHTYTGDGSYQVTISVTDGAATGHDTLAMTVNNVAPTVDAGADQTADEGDEVNLIGSSFSDPGTDDSHVATVIWGDGTVDVGAVSQDQFTARLDGLQHGPANATGSGTFTLNGARTELSFNIVVDINALTGPIALAHIHEGAPGVPGGVVRTLNFVDDTANGTWKDTDGQPLTAARVAQLLAGDLYVNVHTNAFTDGKIRGQIQNIAGPHTYADNGAYLVTVSVTDGAATADDTLTVTVNNVAPTVEAGPDQTVVNSGDTVSLAPSTFSDPGFDCATCVPATQENFTATIDWGDGTVVSGDVTETPGSAGVLTTGTVAGDHIYGVNGVFEVRITVADDALAASSDTLTVFVGAPQRPVIISPKNDTAELNTTFRWNGAGLADSFDLQIATGDFATTPTPITLDVAAEADPQSHTLAEPLAAGTLYEWPVRGKTTAGVKGDFSEKAPFITTGAQVNVTLNLSVEGTGDGPVDITVKLYSSGAFRGIEGMPWLLFGKSVIRTFNFTRHGWNGRHGQPTTNFTLVLPGVTTGFFDITVEADNSLISLMDDVGVHLGQTTVTMDSPVLVGNAVDDARLDANDLPVEPASIINALDASKMVAFIGTTNPGLIAVLDFDRDNDVDNDDFDLLKKNYLRFSPILAPFS